MLCLRHYEKVAKMFSIYVFPDPLASVKLRIEDLSMEMVFLPCNISDTNRLDQDWRVKLIAVKVYNPSDQIGQYFSGCMHGHWTLERMMMQ